MTGTQARSSSSSPNLGRPFRADKSPPRLPTLAFSSLARILESGQGGKLRLTMKFPGDHRRGPETPRLILRAFEESDAEQFYRLNSHPDVIRYTGEPACESVAAAAAGIRSYPDWERYGIGRWGAIWKESGEVIGFAGLKYLPDLQEVDLGYRFLPEYWGQGLATESALVCLAYGFETLGIERIIGITEPENLGSIRVLEKLGMIRKAPFLYDGEPAECFEINSDQFRARGTVDR